MIEKAAGSTIGTQSFVEKPRNRAEVVSAMESLEKQLKPGIQKTVNEDRLKMAIQGANEFLSSSNTHLKFEYHEQLNEYYVTVVDDITSEVVREIPPKKMLDMFAAMTEFVGLMVDEKI
ncbi:flagellar protein FlaG [Rossellomorea marisflavi]|uniref:flagellar protein FlaG n=1 Tax=Rossellomorea marisflavi TaxID=189381 RepID=UPI00296E698E|nr:flagellar protein FlaG [Rossellomorea marisflavi]MDW4528204.1 flagellar protein FlaG [Rossellomorea marisflavi]